MFHSSVFLLDSWILQQWFIRRIFSHTLHPDTRNIIRRQLRPNSTLEFLIMNDAVDYFQKCQSLIFLVELAELISDWLVWDELTDHLSQICPQHGWNNTEVLVPLTILKEGVLVWWCLFSQHPPTYAAWLAVASVMKVPNWHCCPAVRLMLILFIIALWLTVK